jgi:hypothetical protein
MLCRHRAAYIGGARWTMRAWVEAFQRERERLGQRPPAAQRQPSERGRAASQRRAREENDKVFGPRVVRA